MAKFCECPSSGQNMGVRSCPTVMGDVKKHIFVPLFKADGTRNSIKLSDFDAGTGTLLDSYFIGKFNESNKQDRFFITPSKYENLAPSSTDSATEEAPSGRIHNFNNSVLTFEGDIWEQDSTLAGKIKSHACGLLGVYEVSVSNAIRGEESADGLELFPMQIESGSLESKSIETVENSAAQRIKLTFQYSQLLNDSRLMTIKGSDIATDLLNVNGLLDGNTTVLSVPAISATTASITLTYNCFNTFGTNGTGVIQGQDNAAYWELLDGVTPVSISTVIDVNGNGTQYDFTFTSTPTTTLTLGYINVVAVSTDQGFDIANVDFDTP